MLKNKKRLLFALAFFTLVAGAIGLSNQVIHTKTYALLPPNHGIEPEGEWVNPTTIKISYYINDLSSGTYVENAYQKTYVATVADSGGTYVAAKADPSSEYIAKDEGDCPSTFVLKDGSYSRGVVTSLKLLDDGTGECAWTAETLVDMKNPEVGEPSAKCYSQWEDGTITLDQDPCKYSVITKLGYDVGDLKNFDEGACYYWVYGENIVKKLSCADPIFRNVAGTNGYLSGTPAKCYGQVGAKTVLLTDKCDTNTMKLFGFNVEGLPPTLAIGGCYYWSDPTSPTGATDCNQESFKSAPTIEEYEKSQPPAKCYLKLEDGTVSLLMDPCEYNQLKLYGFNMASLPNPLPKASCYYWPESAMTGDGAAAPAQQPCDASFFEGAPKYDDVKAKVAQSAFDKEQSRIDCTDATSCVNNNPLFTYLVKAIDFLSGAVAIVVVLVITLAGIQYSMAGGDPGKTAQAKKRILNAIIALVAYFTMFMFMQWLVPGGFL